ncbi:hypothetical protein BASA81_010281 [Batrachochytrium salamandrivorans]|nr:hypothetical protein BASA81_010281 [Batrachochytrium salamandrivorans]
MIRTELPLGAIKARMVEVFPSPRVALEANSGTDLDLAMETPRFSLQISNNDSVSLGYLVKLHSMHQIKIASASGGVLGSQQTCLVVIELSNQERDLMLMQGTGFPPTKFSITFFYQEKKGLLQVKIPIRLLAPTTSCTATRLLRMGEENNALRSRVRSQPDKRFDFTNADVLVLKPFGSKQFMMEHQGYCSLCKREVNLQYGEGSQRLHRTGKAHERLYAEYVRDWHLQHAHMQQLFSDSRKIRCIQACHNTGQQVLRQYMSLMFKDKAFAKQLFACVVKCNNQISIEVLSLRSMTDGIEAHVLKVYAESINFAFPKHLFYSAMFEHLVGARGRWMYNLIRPWLMGGNVELT